MPSDSSEESESTENDNDKFEDAQERTASATVSLPPSESSPPIRRSTRVSKPPVRYGLNLLSQALVTQKVPVSFKSATSPDSVDFWQTGIHSEHDCLIRNGAWDLIDYTPDLKVLPCKYVFKLKGNKPKVRFVALGCRQSCGIDY